MDSTGLNFSAWVSRGGRLYIYIYIYAYNIYIYMIYIYIYIYIYICICRACGWGLAHLELPLGLPCSLPKMRDDNVCSKLFLSQGQKTLEVVVRRALGLYFFDY